MLINSTTNAVSFNQTQRIYYKLIQANNMHNAPVLRYRNDGSINADYGGGVITVNTGLMGRVNSSEMALVLGHELAHWRGVYNESRADIKGAQYIEVAGWNRCVARSVFLKFPKGNDGIHPDNIYRYNSLHCGK